MMASARNPLRRTAFIGSTQIRSPGIVREKSITLPVHQGGPAGIQALAATINEDQQTLEDVVEPFLLKIGFIVRTPQGRRTTHEGFEHMGLEPRLGGPTGQGTLL